MVIVHQKADGAAIHTAAEAVIELFIGRDRERGSLLAMKRAVGFVIGSGFFQWHIAIYQVDNVDSIQKLINEVLGDAACHAGILPLGGGEHY